MAQFIDDSELDSDFSGFESDDIPDTVSSDEDTTSSEDWSVNLEAVDVRPFVAESGPSHSLSPSSSERDFFSLFFPEAAVQLMVDETNMYAYRQQQQRGTDRYWDDVSLAEMYALLGLLIYMGLMVASELDFYWSSNSFLGIKGFKDVMSLRRFRKLLQYLHLTDTINPNDKLGKIRPIIDIVSKTFADSYRPNQNQSIDEGMIAYRGRFAAKQYMPSKPIKWGIKVWMRCDSKTGYCHQFDIYCGKDNQQHSRPIGHRVVTKLTKGLRGRYHHIFFDSFFTSVPLVRSLLRHGLYACGTVVKNRKGLPEGLKALKPLRQGQFAAMQSDNLVATVWQDKKSVTILSTNADPTKIDTAARRQKDGSVMHITCPDPVSLYQQHFRGVDVCDQLRSTYEIGKPSKKWWKYVLNFIINLCVINGFLTMVESEVQLPVERKRYRQLNFRMRLAKQLINGFQKTPATHRGVSIPPVYGGLVEGDHSLVRLARKRSTCKVCIRSDSKKRRDTAYGCSTCDTHICSSECLNKFHSEE